MNTSQLKKSLLRDEGLRNKVYLDSKGIPTIGIGRNLQDRGLSATEINFLFDNDINEVIEEVYKNFPWAMGLDEPRQEVLANMAFQLGINGLLNFKKTLRFIELHQFDQAADEMLDSKWYREDTPARAKRMSEQMRTGIRK